MLQFINEASKLWPRELDAYHVSGRRAWAEVGTH